jgi:hypothetical protein
MQDPRFSQYPSGQPPPGPGYPAHPSQYPPQVHPWAGVPVAPKKPGAVPVPAILAVACFIALLLAGVVVRLVWFPATGPHSGAPEAGVVKYGHSGYEDGSVAFEAGISRENAKVVGDYLRQTGWFRGEAPASRVAGFARGSYGIGSATRGYGLPLAKLEADGAGYRVIVFTSETGYASDELRGFGYAAQRELTSRLGGKHVTVAIRLERKEGRGLAWDELFWDGSSAPQAE